MGFGFAKHRVFDAFLRGVEFRASSGFRWFQAIKKFEAQGLGLPC